MEWTSDEPLNPSQILASLITMKT